MRIALLLLRAVAVTLSILSGLSIAAAEGPLGPGPGRGDGASLHGRGAGGKALVTRGLAALEANELPAAFELFTAAYRQSPRPEVLYQLGRIAMLEGRTTEAYDIFRRYLADPAREPDATAADVAEKFIAERTPPGGSVSVRSDPGALVIVDGRIAGTLPLSLPLLLSPGEHQVILEFPKKKLEAPLSVEAGRVTELRISRTSGAVLVSELPAMLFLPAAFKSAQLPEGSERVLHEALDQAVQKEQYTLLPRDLALPQAPELKDCLEQERCQRQLAQKNKLELLLIERTSAEGEAPAKTWKLELRLLRVDIVEPAAAANVTCQACTLEQAAARLKEISTQVLEAGLSRPHGTLRVTSDPPAATVRLGDRPALSPTPYSEALWAGSYGVTVSQEGYETQRRSVDVADGQEAQVEIRLQKPALPERATKPPAATVLARARRPIWRLAVGGALLAVGVGLVITGGVELPLDGQCVDSPKIAGGTCPVLYNTETFGGATLGIGAGLTIAGTVLMALPGPWRQVPVQ